MAPQILNPDYSNLFGTRYTVRYRARSCWFPYRVEQIFLRVTKIKPPIIILEGGAVA